MVLKAAVIQVLASSVSSPSDTPKMRSSCRACADSKVGCTKGRPTCARCERRGVPCVYLATKRAGRPVKKRPQSPPRTHTESSTSPSTTHLLLSNASPSSRSVNADASWGNTSIDMTETPNIFTNTPLPSLSHGTIGDMDWCFSPDYSGLLESLGDDGTFSLDSFLMPIVPGPVHQKNAFQEYDNADDTFEDACQAASGPTGDNNDTILSSSHHTTGSSKPTDPFVVPDTPSNDAYAPITPSFSPSAFKDFSPPSIKPSSFSHNEHSFRGCLARCLCFLEELTPHGITDASDANDKTDDSDSTHPSASFEGVIAQTRTVVDAVDDILLCPCSRNSVLLFNLALVILRILGWYAACACVEDDAPSNAHRRPRKSSIVRRPSQLTMLDYDVELDQQDRVICQIVLSRLHSIRRTLKMLTQRLVETEEKPVLPITTSLNDPIGSAAHDSGSLLLGQLTFAPFNPTNLGKSLISTLQCHLNELSQKCVKILSEM